MAANRPPCSHVANRNGAKCAAIRKFDSGVALCGRSLAPPTRAARPSASVELQATTTFGPIAFLYFAPSPFVGLPFSVRSAAAGRDSDIDILDSDDHIHSVGAADETVTTTSYHFRRRRRPTVLITPLHLRFSRPTAHPHTQWAATKHLQSGLASCLSVSGSVPSSRECAAIRALADPIAGR